MNKLKEYILPIGKKLYRYDIKEPPKEWSSDFKNPEDVYSNTGIKNLIGAFFFFNSRIQAVKTANCAFRKHINTAEGIWITECTIKEYIRLLDLRDSIICIELLAAFDKAGFDIFSDKLKSWEGIQFSKLANIIKPIEDVVLSDTKKWINDKELTKIVRISITGMQKILNIENTNIGHLLQLLTDFTNGAYFKKLLQDNMYEGYIFNETNCPIPITGSDTVCIFNSTKFLAPRVEVINYEKETSASINRNIINY